MKKLFLIFLLFNSVFIFSQKIELPKGWSVISLRGKPAYIHLKSGKVFKEKPKKDQLDFTFDDDDDDEIFDPTITHKIKAGETIYTIAKKYKLTIEALKLLNNEADLVKLTVGKEIILGYAHTLDEKKDFFNGNLNILKHDHDH